MFFKFLYCFKNTSVIKLLVSRNPLRNSTVISVAYIKTQLGIATHIDVFEQGQGRCCLKKDIQFLRTNFEFDLTKLTY